MNGHSEQKAAHAASSALDPELVSRLTPTMRRFTLCGKVAVVTGGARGLGHAMAQGLAEAGAKGIAILDINQELGELSSHLLAEQTGVECRFYRVDVKNEHAIQKTVGQIIEHFGAIDVLVHSAGIADNIAAETYPTEKFRHLLDINLTGSFLMAKACAQHMIATKTRGSIILIASMSGSIVNFPQEQCAYNASKAGVVQLARSMAAEWAEFGIRVNAISPGYMDTALTRQHGLDAAQALWRSRTPLGRLGDTSELNNLAVFLASEGSSYVVGANCMIDGGYTLY